MLRVPRPPARVLRGVAEGDGVASGKLSVACPAETVVITLLVLFADEAADVGRLPSALPRFDMTTSRTLGTLC